MDKLQKDQLRESGIEDPSSHELIIHVGGIGNHSPGEILAHLVPLGSVLGCDLLSDADRRALRISFKGTFLDVKKVRISLLEKYPEFRIKLIPTGDSLKKKIYVKIHPAHSKSMLMDYFSKFGTVKKVDLKFNPNTCKSRNFCYVTFQDEEAARIAVSSQEHILAGRYIICEACKPFQLYSTKGDRAPQKKPDQLVLPRNASISAGEDQAFSEQVLEQLIDSKPRRGTNMTITKSTSTEEELKRVDVKVLGRAGTQASQEPKPRGEPCEFLIYTHYNCNDLESTFASKRYSRHSIQAVHRRHLNTDMVRFNVRSSQVSVHPRTAIPATIGLTSQPIHF
mgnify:CR=1 FL=1